MTDCRKSWFTGPEPARGGHQLRARSVRFEEPVGRRARSEAGGFARGVAERGLVLLLHLDPQRRGLVTDDVTRLLDQVFGPLPEIRLVIAHAGGSGGFGPWPRSVLETLATWLEREAAAGRPRARVQVDLSTVPLIRESEGLPPSSEEEIAALAPALRRLGLERVLFASDHPVFDPRDQAEFLRTRCGLTAAELATIFSGAAWGEEAANADG